MSRVLPSDEVYFHLDVESGKNGFDDGLFAWLLGYGVGHGHKIAV